MPGQLLLLRTADLALPKICACSQMTLHQSQLSRCFRYIREVFYNYIFHICACDTQTCEEQFAYHYWGDVCTCV